MCQVNSEINVPYVYILYLEIKHREGVNRKSTFWGVFGLWFEERTKCEYTARRVSTVDLVERVSRCLLLYWEMCVLDWTTRWFICWLVQSFQRENFLLDSINFKSLCKIFWHLEQFSVENLQPDAVVAQSVSVWRIFSNTVYICRRCTVFFAVATEIIFFEIYCLERGRWGGAPMQTIQNWRFLRNIRSFRTFCKSFWRRKGKCCYEIRNLRPGGGTDFWGTLLYFKVVKRCYIIYLVSKKRLGNNFWGASRF